jgi:hypothetical protein
VATDDRQVLVAGQASAPATYKIPGAGQIRPKVIFAKYDGTGTTADYVPALKITSDGGQTVGIFPAFSTVAAGGSVNVSWFPGVEPDDDTAIAPGGKGTISAIVSPLTTISVTGPNGPTTSLDLPTSGVAAGTYGDATHTAQVQVNAEGIVTSATQVGISGIAGSGLVLLFDSTLAAPATNIDTGANAIPTGHQHLMIVVLAQTAQALALSSANITFNGDTAAHYDNARVTVLNAAALTSGRVNAASNLTMSLAGTVAGNYPSSLVVTVPSYDLTTFNKLAQWSISFIDQGAGEFGWEFRSGGWRSTAAINQVTFNSGSGNLVTGSRMTIYGTQ